MSRPIKLKWGRAVHLVPVYGAMPGSLHDDFMGDVRICPPSPAAINPRGRKMWSVWTRMGRQANSYHRSEINALRASRPVIRSYYGR